MESLNHTTSNITSISVAKQVSTGFFSLCFLLGLPGNICVVVFILRHIKKDNFTMHLMLNLAISDILCLTTLPWFVYNLNFNWMLGRILCKLLFILVLTSIYAAVFTVTLMSVQRYMMVLHRNQWNKLGRKGERILLFCLWILALIFAIPDAMTGDINEKQSCERMPKSELKIFILLQEILLAFVIPLSIIVSCYYCLYKKVNQTAFFSNQRLSKLVTAIVLTFVILWTPVHVISLVWILATALRSTNPSVSNKLMSFWESSHIIGQSFTFLNSCVNPLLYVCSSRQLFQNSERPQGSY